MTRKIKSIVAMVVLMAALLSLFSGCGKTPAQSHEDNHASNNGSAADSNQNMNNEKQSDDDQDTQANIQLTGDDVFGGERFAEMIWGYYEADCYDYDGSYEAADTFLTDMEFITMPLGEEAREVAALPLDFQAGEYSHFLGSFGYEEEYYELYTEKGRAMYRKAYVAEVGDMTEEQFRKIEAVLQLDVVSMTLAAPDGDTYSCMLAYEIENNNILLYDVSIDDDYNITFSDEPVVKYSFLHDGGKLSLLYKNVQRDYLASGYKESEPSLYCSGYALNENNKYEDLEGIYFYRYGADEEITAYVSLSNGEDPVDVTMDLDVKTGEFTISWQQVWTIRQGNHETIDAPCTISGKLVPCTSYGFTTYEGFFLMIDGECYRYLMSSQEYDERKYSNVLDGGSAGDYLSSDLAQIEAKKRSILEELKAALDAAGIAASIDTVSGQVTLEANFLFATNSAEVSAEGQDYLNRFIDAYTSVVLGDTYAEYISKIVVEGHTDTSGSYSLNQQLSEERANAVADHCITRSPELASMIQTKGCSYDFPVYNDDGSVNMDKSRRVTFHFVFADA